MQLSEVNRQLTAALLGCGDDPGILSIDQAHAAMQLHIECTVSRCRVRRAARAVLVDSGRYVLDPRAQR